MSFLRKLQRKADQGKSRLERKQVIVECPQCKRSGKLERVTKQRKIRDEIMDVGIDCPHCRHWTHSFYETAAIKVARAALNKAKGEGAEAESEAKRQFDEVFANEQKRVAELVEKESH